MYQITLRAARVNTGLTVDEVAYKLHKATNTINKYERDSTAIPRDLFRALVELYNVPEELVYCGKESDKNGFRGRVRQKRKIS